MADHLSRHTLDKYFRRRLTPTELLAVGDHIANCAACRERLRQFKNPDIALSRLRASVQSAHETLPHLTQVQLTNYADGRMEAVDRELAENHLDTCESCRRTLATVLSDADARRR